MPSWYLVLAASLFQNYFAFPSRPLGLSLEEEIKEKMSGWLIKNLQSSKPAIISLLIRDEQEKLSSLNSFLFTAVLEDWHRVGMFLWLWHVEWCQAPGKWWRGSKRLLLGRAAGEGGMSLVGITCASQCWASSVPKPPGCRGAELAFKTQSSPWCSGVWLGSQPPWLSPALPPRCGRGRDEWSTKYTKRVQKSQSFWKTKRNLLPGRLRLICFVFWPFMGFLWISLKAVSLCYSIKSIFTIATT